MCVTKSAYVVPVIRARALGILDKHSTHGVLAPALKGSPGWPQTRDLPVCVSVCLSVCVDHDGHHFFLKARSLSLSPACLKLENHLLPECWDCRHVPPPHPAGGQQDTSYDVSVVL